MAERAFNCTPLKSETTAVIEVPAGIAAPLKVAAVLVYNATVPVPSETVVVVVNVVVEKVTLLIFTNVDSQFCVPVMLLAKSATVTIRGVIVPVPTLVP